MRITNEEIARAHESLGLTAEIADRGVYDRTVERFRRQGIALPTFAELADPSTIPKPRIDALAGLDRNEPDARNLFRVHWFGRLDGSGPHAVPDHIELPAELTGVEARIVLAFGNRFPMIRSHKVLATYACLVPRLVTGRFDPTANRAVWPSTGNYARGGVAISRIMGCRGVAVLPEGMSKARFDWLEQWTLSPDEDIVRTPGTESNVKEIYDACNEMAKDPSNEIINQFSEFANHLAHYAVTGPALERVFEHVTADRPDSRMAAFVSASGSAGTLGAGDHLKETHGARVVAVEALECPTMLENGFGEHNIQGIGDKHIPLIHNVMNTDHVVAVSDRSTDALDALFNTPAGRSHLVDRVGLDPDLVESLIHMGYSSSCNALAAIKVARELDLGPEDVIVSVATDGSELYDAEREAYLSTHHPDGYDAVAAAADFGRELESADTARHLECGVAERRRIFNLGYYTWVEQQGTRFDDFVVRRDRNFWDGLRHFLADWDELISEFNARTGTRDDEFVHLRDRRSRRVTSTFETYRERLDCYRAARSEGLTDDDVVDAIRALDGAVKAVDGVGFDPTPLTPSPELAAALGLDAELWVKDETGNVSGSHKGRHLFGVALGHELARRAGRNPDGHYAIASCGNAALAAAVVAKAVSRPLDVFVPTWANQAVTDRIEELGARVVRSPRRPGVVGDPSHRAFVAALAEGAVGFSVQGTETPTTIDGCRTLAYEIVDQLETAAGQAPVRIDRLFVQVGGGALATAVVTGLAASPALSALPRVHAVQPRGNHPLVRAWDRLVAELLDEDEPLSNPQRATAAVRLGRADEATARQISARLEADGDRYMQPWPTEPVSYATGILDDVTYDWIPVIEAMIRTGGFPIVAEEEDLVTAHRLGRAQTAIDVCPTGAAGLGGLVGSLRDGSMEIEAGERLVVIFSGRTRPGDPVPEAESDV